MRKHVVSIVIPIYCNEESVRDTYSQVRSELDKVQDEYTYEFVFVDDGSLDGSYDVLRDIRTHDSAVRVIRFTRNFGQMAALTAGLKRASGECCITISADLQDPASLIPEMLEKWAAGSEIVICSRMSRDDGFAERWQSRLAYGLLRLSHPQMPKGGFDYVLIGRNALDSFNSVDNRNRYFQGDLLWSGYSTSVIPYHRRERTKGKSGYTFWKKMKNFLDAILVASYLPIRFISFIGLLTSLIGLVYALTVIAAWAFGYVPFSGWAPIIIINLIVGGMTIITLGIIGEYIWRIYDEVRKRPNYIVLDEEGGQKSIVESRKRVST